MIKTNPSQVKLTYTNDTPKQERIKITSPSQMYDALISNAVFDQSTIEQHMSVKVILFNRDNQILGIYSISEGGIYESLLDIKLIYQSALLANASGFILVRNSPSGNLKPSQQDKALSKILEESSKIMQFDYIDFIIISPDGYLSLADEGLVMQPYEKPIKLG